VTLLAGCSSLAEQVACIASPARLPVAAACEPCRPHHPFDPSALTGSHSLGGCCQADRCHAALPMHFSGGKCWWAQCTETTRATCSLLSSCPHSLVTWGAAAACPPAEPGSSQSFQAEPGSFSEPAGRCSCTHVLPLGIMQELSVCLPERNGLVR